MIRKVSFAALLAVMAVLSQMSLCSFSSILLKTLYLNSCFCPRASRSYLSLSNPSSGFLALRLMLRSAIIG